ncbi:MAG: hypothetical protein ABGX04_09640 [Myxococcales bacterium]|nr:hypothetical protein [Myxococcales bacterium]
MTLYADLFNESLRGGKGGSLGLRRGVQDTIATVKRIDSRPVEKLYVVEKFKQNNAHRSEKQAAAHVRRYSAGTQNGQQNQDKSKNHLNHN